MASYIDDDFVRVQRAPSTGADRVMTLTFGDEVELLDSDETDWQKVRIVNWVDGQAVGFIKASAKLRDEPILRFSMVDVQQGDGMVLETPGGKIVFVDAGENQLFARHVAERFRHRAPTPANPLEVDAVIITHGDADHFAGLNQIRLSEDHDTPRKRLPIHPKRVFTNGLVKAPDSMPDIEMLGPTVGHDGRTYAVDLFADPRGAGPGRLNTPFRAFGDTLDHWEQRGPIAFHRVDAAMDPAALFDFLVEEGITVDLLGPIAEDVPDPDGTGTVRGLRWFPKPKRSPEVHLEQGDGGAGTPSLSHTINGHSIGLRLTYKNVRLVLTGDMNHASMQLMHEQVGEAVLEGEFVKAPHHGSHEFDDDALKATRPVVAAVSSGDESTRVEHIHPRATMVAALGRATRSGHGVVFSTELAAFFHYRKESYTAEELATFFGAREDETFKGEDLRDLFRGTGDATDRPRFFHGFERTNFGIIHLRTDGERLLAFTHSGEAHVNEAYRFKVTIDADGDHRVTPQLLTTR